MKKLLSIAAASLACVTAGAQTANFEGLSGTLNLNNVTSKTKIPQEDNFQNFGGQSWNGSIQAAYGFSLSPIAVISVGGTYGIGSSNVGDMEVNHVRFEMLSGSAFSLYAEPGLVISNNTLIYGKISYEAAKRIFSITNQTDESTSMKGTGFGAGIRTMLNKNTFIQVEFKHVDYGNADIPNIGYSNSGAQTKSTVGTVGIGMKF